MRGLLIPKVMHFQFDNCGENKVNKDIYSEYLISISLIFMFNDMQCYLNKEMFCYTSPMVELGYFDKFHVNFLVVGHTHCNLDQSFSILAKRIYKAPYIASPPVMQELIGIAHKVIAERPRYNIQLEVVHDYKAFFFSIHTSINR